MQLLRLEFADIYRDGGSYEAFFATAEPLGYCVCLFRSGRPTAAGLRHKYLYAFRNETPANLKIPENAAPVISGSDEEHDILQNLESYAKFATSETPEDKNSLERLREMTIYIREREPCLPSDSIFNSQSQT